MIPIQSREHAFESAISAATRALNGQLPRPWMTDLTNPLSAQVLIVGRNPARGYDAATLDHARHLDALFNRNGESCRGLYDEIVEPSATRRNIDLLRALLRNAGIDQVLETNVICYSSPMSADLNKPEHTGGREAGTAIFRLLLEYVRPRVLIAHGAGTIIRDVGTIVGATLPPARSAPGAPVHVDSSNMRLILLPSLAPPAWNRWQGWAPAHLEAAADLAAAALR